MISIKVFNKKIKDKYVYVILSLLYYSNLEILFNNFIFYLLEITFL